MATKKEGQPAAKPAKEQLHTESPISEKDEVKEAEERLNKPTDPSVANGLKKKLTDTVKGQE